MIGRPDAFYGVWMSRLGRTRSFLWARVHEIRLSASAVSDAPGRVDR